MSFPAIKREEARDRKGFCPASPPLVGIRTMQAPQGWNPISPPSTDLSAAVAAGIRAPLAALRASMESLAQDFDGADPRALALSGALSVRETPDATVVTEIRLPRGDAAECCR